MEAFCTICNKRAHMTSWSKDGKITYTCANKHTWVDPAGEVHYIGEGLNKGHIEDRLFSDLDFILKQELGIDWSITVGGNSIEHFIMFSRKGAPGKYELTVIEFDNGYIKRDTIELIEGDRVVLHAVRATDNAVGTLFNKIEPYYVKQLHGVKRGEH